MLGDLIKEIRKGKSVHKILTNQALADFTIKGKIIDLGGGKKMKWSHFRYLKKQDGFELFSVDIDPKNNPDILANLETDRLPKEDNTFDMVLAFNVIEHIYNHKHFLSEAYRVLKYDGELLGSVPFLLRVHPDPDDFFRYTVSALKKIIREAGFREFKIIPAGMGPNIAGYLQKEAYIPKWMRLFFALPAYFLDKMLLKMRPRTKEYYPLSYIFWAKK